MLKKSLRGILGEKESEELISAFDQIGDIIIVRIPDSLLPKKEIIGQALLREVKAAKSVFCQASAVGGDFRTRNLEVLAGEGSTETVYREFGCRFTVDVENAFFSPRLSTERERIAGLVRDGETVVNMFAGVGMFSVMAARKARCTVYSIDINPVASRLCEENARSNRLLGRVVSINGDARQVIRERLEGTADRTLMLLPEKSDEFLDAAASATKDGGTVHYYSHVHSDRKADAARLSEEHLVQASPAGRFEVLGSRVVRPVGPRYYQTVVDARISK